MRRWAALLSLSIAGCPDDVAPGECPDGHLEVAGVCRLSCTRDTQCLLSEVCQQGACAPQVDPKAPVIRLFEAEPAQVPLGGSTRIDYVVLFAESVEIAGTGPSGSVSVLPQTGDLAGTVGLSSIGGPMELTLIARRGDGSVSETLTIALIDEDLPVIERFQADPQFVQSGEPTLLEWTVRNASYVRISDGTNVLTDLELSGSRSVQIFMATDFTLEASNEDGDIVSANVSVGIETTTPPSIDLFLAVPESVPFDVPALVVWKTTDAFDVQVLDGMDAELVRSESLPEAGAGAWLFWSPPGRIEATLLANNSAGTSEAKTNVARFPPPADAVLQLIQAEPLIASDGAELVVTWQAGPPEAVVELYLDGIGPSPAASNDSFRETLIDSVTPREVRLVASVAGGGVAEAKHTVYGQVQEGVTSRDAPQVLSRQVVLGSISSDTSVADDWFSVFVVDGGALEVSFAACPLGLSADIVDAATGTTLDSGIATANGCPTLGAAGSGSDLLIRVYGTNVAGEAQYLLIPRALDPICGNGTPEGNEQCDDANRRPLDGCGSYCELEPAYQYEAVQAPATIGSPPPDAISVRGLRARTFAPVEDEGLAIVPLPFPFAFFGRAYHGVVLHTNGFVGFLPDFGESDFDAGAPLSPVHPNAVIALFAGDLIAPKASADALIWADESEQSFSIEVRNLEPKASPGTALSGRITLFADGRIRLDYAGVFGPEIFQTGIQGPDGHPVFSFAGCENGCSGDVLSELGAIELIPGGIR